MLDLSELLTFWGKARPTEESASAYHPAILHCLDVAAVASVLAEERLAGEVGALMPALPFLVALHDIGKFTRGFQQQCPAHWPEAAFGPFRPAAAGPRHDTAGYWLLRHHCAATLGPLLPDMRAAAREALLRAIAGHHGRPPQEPSDPSDCYPPGLCPQSAGVAAAVAAALAAVFRPAALRPLDMPLARRLSWRLAGITTLADWLGSGPHFPYVDAQSVADLSDYYHGHAHPRARRAVAGAGLRPAVPRPFTGLRGLFPAIEALSPSQEWAEQVELPAGPLLALVEDGTGSGKTEAALTLAHRLIAGGRADGVFVALPTMATAGAMFARMQLSYRRLFAEDAAPSLALTHGRAKLDARFTETILPPGQDGDLSDLASGSSECAAWLADGGRRALLAQVGVGTIDQALLAVLPARHAALRQLGLSSKVLLVDEVHAYDAYMRTEIFALLRQHAAAGGSAILLSATLTRDLRRRFVAAFAEGRGLAVPPLACSAYPLATLASEMGVMEAPRAMRPRLARRVAVRRLDNAAAAVAAIAAAASTGAAVAWIRNTVNDAMAGHAALAAAGVAATLFHARFAMVDRLSIERAVLGHYGKDSTARAGVVVATQVLEQSLDLDFDLIVTDAAPADLLIQRAGRLWRHARPGARPLPAAELLVVCPDPVADPAEDWLSAVLPGTAAIYPPPLVWRSARAIFAAGAIDTPGNVRVLVEAAYDAEAAVPAAFERAENRSGGKDSAAVSMARMNVLAMGDGYSRKAGAWDSDTRTPTRLSDEAQVTLRLARKAADGRVVPWAEDAAPTLAWALSEVRVAARLVAEVPVPPGLEAAVAAARAGWGRWEREAAEIKLVVLAEESGEWTAAGSDKNDSDKVIIYNESVGLMTR